ncbi:peptide chain release factor N(5)-glutamine methyltransferase [Mesomycoplasma lagogenitalium]|uniref:peptide chain release factor N(5)-glutamine methyltransferase n=1 Tax=Mesomycoplasma lagogenitalium TaxID=171286 RepID=A0ABY8LWJ6_9BACT|nr:peptide chain release factor N(5)-glutamine methyltransferase [Mesomycoplasma lagogenitalium]WGI36796.1 peptide chain release factor N(5)-glutamine methyltransferase [Mesomycoplasma lagogenitalium]
MQDYNIRKKLLLKEKLRHNLPLKIGELEKEKLKSDMPIQLIVGFIEMQNVKILLKDNKLLIPRYETEEVIIESFNYINKHSKVLDLCCGTGFIGIAIAKNVNCQVSMVDIDENAIYSSVENAKINNVDKNTDIYLSDLFSSVPKTEQFDLIISNPPYIPENIVLDSSVLNWENHQALFAKEKGNYFYRLILENAKSFLKPKGYLIFEISDWNVNFLKKYPNIDLKIKKDINNKNRIAIIQYKK